MADLEAYGHRIVQLHPGDLGLLVELDEIPDADEWFWDETEKEVSLDPWVDDILGVDVSSPDPARTATLWAEVFGKKPVSAQPLSIRLGSRVVSFVPGERSMLTAIDLAASSGASAVEPGLSVGGGGIPGFTHAERASHRTTEIGADRSKRPAPNSCHGLKRSPVAKRVLSSSPASVAWQLLDEPNRTGALEVSQSLA